MFNKLFQKFLHLGFFQPGNNDITDIGHILGGKGAAEVVGEKDLGIGRKFLIPFVLSLHGNRYYTEVEVGRSLACGF